MGIWTVFPLNFFYLYINIFKLFWYVNIKQKIKKKTIWEAMFTSFQNILVTKFK